MAAVRRPGLLDVGARHPQGGGGIADGRHGLARRRGEAVVRVDRDVQSGDVDGAGVAERDRRDAAVGAVGPRDDPQQQRHVRDASGRSGDTCVRGSLSAPSGPSSSITPVIGTRPAVGLIAASPQKCAGSRALAPESVPSPHAEPPAATIAASPPLLPPGVRSRSYGLFVRPWTGLSVSMPPPHGGQFVFPRRIAPASRSRATAVASVSGTVRARAGTPIAIGQAGGLEVVLRRERDAVQRPGGLAAGHGRIRRARASARARSGASATTALSAPSTSAIRARCAATTSSADASRRATMAASAVAATPVSSAAPITRPTLYPGLGTPAPANLGWTP